MFINIHIIHGRMHLFLKLKKETRLEITAKEVHLSFYLYTWVFAFCHQTPF